jgi:dCMP deaminase
MNRISFLKYGLEIAKVAALRSEDPKTKVGAVAFTKENRVVGIAYNGLMAGFETPEGFWDDREKNRKYIVHAEQNLVSLFKRGEAETVFCTITPCNSCMMLLLAHGVKNIYYAGDYAKSEALDIAKMYGINLQKI